VTPEQLGERFRPLVKRVECPICGRLDYLARVGDRRMCFTCYEQPGLSLQLYWVEWRRRQRG
jgi:ribosomal protein S27AE